MSSPADADPAEIHDATIARVLSRPGVAVLLGGIDTGKTTLARRLLKAAVAEGMRAVWVDTDLGQSSVGPPTTVGVRIVDTAASVDAPTRPDHLFFVGDLTPSRHPPTLLTQVARALARARGEADLLVVDTSSYLSGLTAERLKFHKLELAEPAHVVGLQRGEELEQLLSTARRFTGAEATAIPLHPDVRSRSAERRADYRRVRLAAAFDGELRRFRVPPEATTPSLPPGMDLALLDGVLVGLDDGRGNCCGLGRLEHDADGLRLLTAAQEVPRGLRLGSVRIGTDGQPRQFDPRKLLSSV